MLVIAAVAIAILGYTAAGNHFLADQLASRLSTPDMQLRIEGARGLLAGKFQIDRVVVADTKGPFAELDAVAVDWSPLNLLGAEFDAERIAAARVRIDRPPIQTIESEPSGDSFSLPVEIDIRQIDIRSLSLGKDLLGRSAEIALTGSARGAADLLALTLDARQTDDTGARAVADLAYAVNARTLDLKLEINEPKGGLVATMLKLPDGPAIGISVTGNGPLDAWTGKVRAKLDGIDRLALDGSHLRNQAGVHQIVLSGGGAIGELMPPALRPLFEGESAIDIDASFNATGMLDIRSAKLVNGSLSLDVSGAVDPAGEATLNGSLRPAGDVVAFRWPLDGGMLEADIRNAAFTASGPFRKVAFELSTDLARGALPGGSFSDVVARLGSDSFDLATADGALSSELTAEAANFADPRLSRLVRGPIRMTAPVVLSGTTVRAEPIEISSGALGATAVVSFDLQSSALDADFRSFIATQALLPTEIAEKAGNTLELSGKIAGTPDSLAFSDVQLVSNIATARLDGTLADETVSASLVGDIPSLASFTGAAEGRLGLTATLSGPLENLKIDSAATSEKIVAGGRALQNVDIVFGGQFDPAAPGGKLKAVFHLDGEKVDASADMSLRDGTVAISAVNAAIGGNTLTGDLELGSDLLPSGRLRANLADLATVGRLAGQVIEGDLDLAIALKPEARKLAALVTGSGSHIAGRGALLTSPTLRLESPDLIGQFVKGNLRAASLQAAGNTVEKLTLSLDHSAMETALSIDAMLDGAPLVAAADIRQGPTGNDVTLRDLKAAPRGLPLTLAEPATLSIRDGTTTIESLRLAIGEGTATVSGTAGDTLDLKVVVQAVPASIANVFSPGLDATGSLDAGATITGNASSPVVAYDFRADTFAVRPLKDAGRPPLDVSGDGTFENNRLATRARISGIEETGELSVDATVRLDGSDAQIEKLALSSEALTGSVTGGYQAATRTIAAAFQFDLTGKRLLPPQVLSKLKAPIRVTGAIDGTPDDLAFKNIRLTSNLLTADLSGTLRAGMIDAAMKGALPDLSALQPNISGAATFTASVSGPVGAPAVVAELKASDATLVGRKLQSLAAKLDVVADPRAPKGTVTATGLLDGQTIDIGGEIASEGGLFRVPSLKAVIGGNNLTASLALDSAFRPAGIIRFDLPDIGLVAALAGQRAGGDLKGEADLDNAGGTISATIKAQGSGVTADGLSIRAPAIDVNIPDLLTGQVSGAVKATELAFGATRVNNLDATFALEGPKTDFTITASYDDAPLRLEGALLRDAGALELALNSFSAAPRKLPVTLAAPAKIRISDGITDLGTVSLLAAGGRVDISGTVSDRLALKVDAPALPLELVNIVSPGLDASGMLDAHATVTGTPADPSADFTLDGKALSARALRDAGRDPLDVKASGHFENQKLSIKGDIAGIKELGVARISAQIKFDGETVTVDEIALNSPALTARGNAVLKAQTLAARLSGEIVDLTAFLPRAAGRARFTIDADGPLSALPVKLRLKVEDAVMAGKKLSGLTIDATATADPAKPAARLTATGTIDGQAIDASAEVVTRDGRISVPAIKANVGRNTISGSVELGENGLPTGKLTFDLPDIGLLAALGGQSAAGQLTGSLDLVETAGKLSATIKARGDGITAQGVKVDAPIVDLQIPDLLAGQITGTVRAAEIVSGTNRLADLDARFARAGQTTDFDVKGNYDGAPLIVSGALETRSDGLFLTLDEFAASPRKIPVKLSSPVSIPIGTGRAEVRGLRIAAGKGSITVDGVAGDILDLKIRVTSMPASLANTFANGLDASGIIAADATITGNSSSPAVSFTVDWQNAMTSQIRAAGMTALAVRAKGKLAGSRLSIDTDVRGGGLTLNAGGTVDIGSSQALNLTVKGQLPFTAVASQLAAQGLALEGQADFDLKIGGSLSRPDVTGRVTTANAQFTAIRQNLIVKNVAATLTLSGQTATIGSLTGNLEGGGKVSASGTIGFAPGSGLPADIAVKLDRAVYADGRVVVAKLSGDLSVKGPLQRDPTLGGTINLRRADITVPERLPASLANANVKHRNAPADVARQNREIRADASSRADSDKGGGMRLDLKIKAPRQIFVRGRGLDAELGGEVRISGSSRTPNVSGGFKMVRGRLAIISRRLDFTTGEITFGGGMVPYLNMVASTTVNTNTLSVNVTGLANDPSFTFTSSPALPQDEVLAQLIFGRESSSLSPFQIAQLADAVATLSGGQRTSLFDKLRQGLGVDDLNVGTDENGGAQVTAGKYLNRRTYLEVMQGEDPSKSGIAINLDVGKGVKLRGQATQDGGTATGVFFEKEY